MGNQDNPAAGNPIKNGATEGRTQPRRRHQSRRTTKWYPNQFQGEVPKMQGKVFAYKANKKKKESLKTPWKH